MQHPATVYVWVWLPDADEPVVAGRLDDHGSGAVTFAYGRSYLANPDAIALYLPDLPLRSGEIAPTSGTLPGCIADAAPDAWGRRVIEYRLRASDTDLSELAYLLESGSDRAGALDFQASATEYTPRSGEGADLGQLAEAAQRVEDGQPLPPALERALLHGTSIGGARPKVALRDQRTGVIAKFTSSRDTYPVVKAEYIAMELARRAGIDTARVEFAAAAGRDVLLVRRFDRSPPRKRRMMISALTILDLHDAHGIAGRYATYAALADSIRARFGSPRRDPAGAVLPDRVQHPRQQHRRPRQEPLRLLERPRAHPHTRIRHLPPTTHRRRGPPGNGLWPQRRTPQPSRPLRRARPHLSPRQPRRPSHHRQPHRTRSPSTGKTSATPRNCPRPTANACGAANSSTRSPCTHSRSHAEHALSRPDSDCRNTALRCSPRCSPADFKKPGSFVGERPRMPSRL